MEEKKGFSKKLNAFFAGKGFYMSFFCAPFWSGLRSGWWGAEAGLM